MPLYGVFCHRCGKLLGEIETGDKPHLEASSAELGTVKVDVRGMKSTCLKCAEDDDGQDT